MRAIAPDQADKLLRLTGELANQVVRARAVGRPVSRIEAEALAGALHILQDYGIGYPNALTTALDQYDELCAKEDPSREQREDADPKMIRLPQVSALPQRIFSLLGLGR